MNNKNTFIIIAVVFLIIFTLVVFCLWLFEKEQSRQESATFLMIHFEVGNTDWPWYEEIAEGADSKNLKYQESLWPTAVQLVETAEKYNANLTLCFNPQWAEYILKDKEKTKIIKDWQKRGHEIAFHHHGINHKDWNGYSNKPKAKFKKGYRGTAAEGFEFVKKLASPQKVIVGTVTDTVSDLPEEITILTYGGGMYDKGHTENLISNIEYRKPDNKKTAWLGHGFLESFFRNNNRTDNLVSEFKKKYEELEKGEVFGVVTHCHDFHRYPQALEDWLQFINSKNHQIQTVSRIIKNNE